MKRLLSLLVVIAMVVSMIPSVFAAKEEVDMDELLGRLVVLEDIEGFSISLAEGSDGMIYQWTPAADEIAENLRLSWYNEEVVLNVTATTGETIVSATSEPVEEGYMGELELAIVAGQLVEIEISEAEGKAVEAYISGMLELPFGIESNPIPVEGNGFVSTIEKASWYTVRHNGPVVVTGEGDFNVIYEGVTYAAVDGKAEFEVVLGAGPFAPAPKFQIDAAGTYTFSLVVPVGTMDNPAELVMGSNTASLKAGSQGYFYTWTATEEGTLKITMPAGDWSYQVNNMTTYKYGDMQWSDSDPVVNPAEITVAAGDEIQVIVNTYDPANMWEAPAGEITFTAELVLPAPELPDPEITAQPADASVMYAENAQFSVGFSIAEGATYCWQYFYENEWKNTALPGYNTNTLTVAANSLVLNGRQYRCVITYNEETFISDAATLIITVEETKITAQPTDQSAISGDIAVFTFEDDSNGAATYQWMYKGPQGIYWAHTKLRGYATNTLYVPTYDFRDGYQYCCMITTTDGVNTYVEYTDEVTLHVAPVAVFNLQPVDAKADPNEFVTFTVDAVPSGTTINYQWQYSSDGGINWANTGMTGYNTNTLTVQALFARHGYKYRCQITNEFYGLGNGTGTGGVLSDVATLRVNDPVTIKAQPQNVTVSAGETAKFSVKTESLADVTYWWQYSTDGGVTWYTTKMEGYNTNTLSVQALAGRNGYLYRCGITNVRGVNFYSEPAMLTVE